MLLIAAASGEELNTALGLCLNHRKAAFGKNRVWQAVYQRHEICFLKTGMGPARSRERLGGLLAGAHPSMILVVGYAGALDPCLRIGDLVVGKKASILEENPFEEPWLRIPELNCSWGLAGCTELLALAEAIDLPARAVELLTSPSIVGEPAQKRMLFGKYGAAAVDMETAALAAIADAAGIPISCVRSISDEADDEFLAPFSRDPHSRFIGRATRVIAAGNWIKRCRDWRRRAAVARASLRRFMKVYFERIEQDRT